MQNKREDSKNLTREDFDAGPISLNEIEDKLWLGNVTAAVDLNILKTHNITNILTVDSCPLPSYITQISTLNTKYVQISDLPKEDILVHFDDCINFIEKAMDNKNSVLVHCYFGVSRSVSFVIAFLMKKYRLNYEQAFRKVQLKRRFVGPNVGFITQLKLFYNMGFKIDTTNDKYKMYKLRLAADKFHKAKMLPQSCTDLVKPDPGITQTKPDPIVYCCKKCRRVIASKNNIIQHRLKRQTHSKLLLVTDKSTADHQNGMGKSFKDDIAEAHGQSTSLNSEKSSESDIEYCKQIFFVEPIAWMKNINVQSQGRLNCPKCNSKLGNFSWIMGCQCPCGVQVSPAFYLVPSKVEYSNVVQNIQITL